MRSQCFNLYDSVSESCTTSSSSSCDCVETYGGNRNRRKIVEKIITINKKVIAGNDQVFFSSPSANLNNGNQISIGQTTTGLFLSTGLATQIVGLDLKITSFILDFAIATYNGPPGEIGSIDYTLQTYDDQLTPLSSRTWSLATPTLGFYRVEMSVNPAFVVGARDLITLLVRFNQAQNLDTRILFDLSMSCKLEPL